MKDKQRRESPMPPDSVVMGAICTHNFLLYRVRDIDVGDQAAVERASQ